METSNLAASTDSPFDNVEAETTDSTPDSQLLDSVQCMSIYTPSLGEPSDSQHMSIDTPLDETASTAKILTFCDRVKNGQFLVKLENWKYFKNMLFSDGLKFVSDEKRGDFTKFLQELLSQVENTVIDQMDKQERSKTEQSFKRYNNLLKSLELSIVVNIIPTQDVVNPISLDDRIKKIEHLSQELIPKRSIQTAFKIGQLMEEVKPQFKSTKEFINKMKAVTKWSKNYLGFISELSYFISKYQRFLYSTFSIHQIKKDFKAIKKLFSTMDDINKQFWKINPGQLNG